MSRRRSTIHEVGLGEESPSRSPWLWQRPISRPGCSTENNIPAPTLPLNNIDRIKRRDEKLWQREQAYARNFTSGNMKCPCSRCRDLVPALLPVGIVYHHLLLNGRHPLNRLAGRSEDHDSSDEEWEAAFSAQPGSPDKELSDRRQLWPSRSANEAPPVPVASLDPSPNHSPDPPAVDLDESTRFRQMMDDLLGPPRNDAGETNNPPEPEINPHTAAPSGGLPEEDLLGTVTECFEPLYQGSKQTLMEFTVLVVNICAQYRVSNKFADALLCLLRETVLPQPNLVPKSLYYAKKLITRYLGLKLETIDACINGCVLFRKEYADLRVCPKCQEERFQKHGKSMQARNKLRYFPIIPRLLRMFKCPSIATLMTWAHEHKSEGGLVRHAADSEQWKVIDSLYPEFATEPRNARFGLALDGVNPFSLLSTTHSTWPVMLVNYCLPPWQLTKPFFVMLAILICGPQSISKDNIDVYIQPLVEELRLLWTEGVDAFDCLGRYGSHRFRLRAILMWTINDYPALGYISGLCVHGIRGCSVCGGRRGPAVFSNRLGKPVHMGHRKWLPADHVYRRLSYASRFDGLAEEDIAPPRQTAAEILECARQKEEYMSAGGVHNHRDDPYKVHGVFRRSILFDLPYWEHLPVRHCIDVMHLEKNVCESLLGFLLGNKDTPKVREDIKDRGIREHLWIQARERGRSGIKPKAPYVFSKQEKLTFLARLKSVKVPQGYSSNWVQNVEYVESKSKYGLKNMKSHDYHVLMQQLLVACLKGLMDSKVRESIISLSRVFRNLCAKVYDPARYTELREDCILTLCKLEMHFPPAFFDVMTHLILHAVEELHLCGPVHTRWMYWGERILGHYTNYVSTRANPEASIATRYILEEALGFCTEYMADYTGYNRRVWDAQEDEWVSGEVTQGAREEYILSDDEVEAIHEYVLRTVDVFTPFRRQYESWLERQPEDQTPHPFSEWIQITMDNYFLEHPDADWDWFLLSRPPKYMAYSYNHMRAYGNHYRVMSSRGNTLTNYDSGIGGYFEYSSTTSSDVSKSTIVQYVGEITHILQIDYGDLKQPVILLKARWVRPEDPSRHPSFKVDADGNRLANFKQLLRVTDDPYVFPSLVHQLFFLNEDAPSGWRLILRKDPRDCRVFQDPLQDLQDPQIPLADTISDIPTAIRRPDPVEDTVISAQDMLRAGI